MASWSEAESSCTIGRGSEVRYKGQSLLKMRLLKVFYQEVVVLEAGCLYMVGQFWMTTASRTLATARKSLDKILRGDVEHALQWLRQPSGALLGRIGAAKTAGWSRMW